MVAAGMLPPLNVAVIEVNAAAAAWLSWLQDKNGVIDFNEFQQIVSAYSLLYCDVCKHVRHGIEAGAVVP